MEAKSVEFSGVFTPFFPPRRRESPRLLRGGSQAERPPHVVGGDRQHKIKLVATQSAVAATRKVQQPLHPRERMLPQRPHARYQPVPSLLPSRQLALAAFAFVDD